MIDLKLSLLMIISTQLILASESEYGLRLRTQAIARSKIDDRIAAILNSGKQFTDNYSRSVSHISNDEQNGNKINKKYGWESPNNKESVPVIEVNASEMPIDIIFNTNSPKINVQQRHIPGIAPKVESTRSEEEPQRLMHEVYRPVIQELREIIQPFRHIVQQIEPVIQEVQQIISSPKGTPKQNERTLSNVFSHRKLNFGTNSQSDAYPFSKFQDWSPKIGQKMFLSDNSKMIASATRARKLADIFEAPLLTDPLVNDTDIHRPYSFDQSSKNKSENKNKLHKKYLDLGGALNLGITDQTPLNKKPRVDNKSKIPSDNRIEDKLLLITDFFDKFSKVYDLDMSQTHTSNANNSSKDYFNQMVVPFEKYFNQNFPIKI